MFLCFHELFPPQILKSSRLGDKQTEESKFDITQSTEGPMLVNSQNLRSGGYYCQPGHFLHKVPLQSDNDWTQIWVPNSVSYHVPFNDDKNLWYTSILETTPKKRDATAGVDEIAAPNPQDDILDNSDYNLCPQLKGKNTCCQGMGIYIFQNGQTPSALIEMMRSGWMTALRSHNNAIIYPKCYKLVKDLFCSICDPAAFTFTWMTNTSHPRESDILKSTSSQGKRIPLLQIIPCVEFVDKLYDECKNVPYDSTNWIVPRRNSHPINKYEFRNFMGIPLKENMEPIDDYPKLNHTSYTFSATNDATTCFAGY